MQTESMWLVAGLGNPGRQYDKNWHNLGYLAIDALSERYSIPVNRVRFKGLSGSGSIEGVPVLLLKPATFMNHSGESVESAASFYKIPAERILILYDDIDIDCGRIRIRPHGSAGTHNGMRSVIYRLNSAQFPRIRIGSGPKPELVDMVDYVLSNIPETLRQAAYESVLAAASAVRCILMQGIERAMNEYNGNTISPQEPVNK